jgi:hypothetical protein
MKRSTLRRLLLCSLPFMLSACGLEDWANANMPVIGQRCEHWQCFTEGGQQQSDANHQERLREQAGGGAGSGGNVPAENPGAPPAPVPTQAAAPAQAAAAPYVAPDPMAPGMPPVPTYQYVPRAPAAPGTTPFDGNIPPVEPPAE